MNELIVYLTWDDGTTKEFKYPSTPRGVRLGNARPTGLQLNRVPRELKEKEWLYRDVMPSLHPQSEVLQRKRK